MGSTQPGTTFSLVYATPLLQHQDQFGLNPALLTMATCDTCTGLYPTPAGSGKLQHWENTPPLECVAFTLDGWTQAIVKSRVTNYCQQVHYFGKMQEIFIRFRRSSAYSAPSEPVHGLRGSISNVRGGQGMWPTFKGRSLLVKG